MLQWLSIYAGVPAGRKCAQTHANKQKVDLISASKGSKCLYSRTSILDLFPKIQTSVIKNTEIVTGFDFVEVLSECKMLLKLGIIEKKPCEIKRFLHTSKKMRRARQSSTPLHNISKLLCTNHAYHACHAQIKIRFSQSIYHA
jgi:hypothetical protein